MTDLANYQHQLLMQLNGQLARLQQQLQQYQGDHDVAVLALSQLAIFQPASTLVEYGQQVAAHLTQLAGFVSRTQTEQVQFLAEKIGNQMQQLWRQLEPAAAPVNRQVDRLAGLQQQQQQYQHYYQRLHQQLQTIESQLAQALHDGERQQLQQQSQQWQQRLQRCQLALDQVNQQLQREDN